MLSINLIIDNIFYDPLFQISFCIAFLLGFIIIISKKIFNNYEENFFEPLNWSLNKQYARDGDIYSLLQIYFIDSHQVYMKYLSIIFIFGFNTFILFKVNKLKNELLKMSLIFICPLLFFPHSNYDYILLFPLACYSLLNINTFLNKINFYFVIYFFYFSRLIKHLLDLDWLYQPILLTFMLSLIFVNIKFNPKIT